MCFISRHQAGWFPFRPDQQNLRGGERAGAPQGEAERHQDIQEIVSGRMSLSLLSLHFVLSSQRETINTNSSACVCVCLQQIISKFLPLTLSWTLSTSLCQEGHDNYSNHIIHGHSCTSVFLEEGAKTFSSPSLCSVLLEATQQQLNLTFVFVCITFCPLHRFIPRRECFRSILPARFWFLFLFER